MVVDFGGWGEMNKFIFAVSTICECVFTVKNERKRRCKRKNHWMRRKCNEKNMWKSLDSSIVCSVVRRMWIWSISQEDSFKTLREKVNFISCHLFFLQASVVDSVRHNSALHFHSFYGVNTQMTMTTKLKQSREPFSSKLKMEVEGRKKMSFSHSLNISIQLLSNLCHMEMTFTS